MKDRHTPEREYRIPERAAGAWSSQSPPYCQAIEDRQFVCLKEEWLKRIMMVGSLTPSHRVVAYFLVESLNWATMDCWPSHETLAGLVGTSTKTIQRSLSCMEGKGLLSIYRRAGSSHPLRYAPVYLTDSRDKGVSHPGQECLETPDAGVHESFLKTLPESSLRPAGLRSKGLTAARSDVLPFNIAQRGRLETQVAPVIGSFDVLLRLATIHDDAVTRVCIAHQAGYLGPRQIKAAKLAAAQCQLG